jgi:hypothetical protein
MGCLHTRIIVVEFCFLKNIVEEFLRCGGYRAFIVFVFVFVFFFFLFLAKEKKIKIKEDERIRRRSS